MRVGAATTEIYSVQQTRVGTTPTASVSAGLGQNSIAEDEQGVKTADFRSMTREDMRNWLNEQIRSGKMTLDDSSPFMAMTMKVPVAGGIGETLVTTDSERINFVENVRAGIDGAQSRGDITTTKMLESALLVISRSQGHAVGIDTHA